MSRPSQAPFRVAVLAVLTLVGGFAVGALLVDSDPDRAVEASGGPDLTGGTPTANKAALTAATSCDTLLDRLVEATVDRVGPWGWDGQFNGYWARNGLVDQATAEVELSSARMPMNRTMAFDSQSSSETGTNVQEVGVDEPDIAKTDGDIMVRVDRRTLTTYDVSGKEIRKLGTLKLKGRFDQPELLLSGDRVLVVGSAWHHVAGGKYRYTGGYQNTRVVSVDVSTPAAPTVVDTTEYDGQLLSARLTGDDVRLVTSTGLPTLDFVQPNRKRTRKEAKAENKQIVRESDVDDWLPAVKDGDEFSRLVECEDLNIPAEVNGIGVMAVTGFRADEPTKRWSTGVLTDSQLVYSSPDRLYLATGYGWGGCCMLIDSVWGGGRGGGEDGFTDLHTFALAGPEATYLASGRVKGNVADRWSMDSVGGTLRVAVATTIKRGEGKKERNVGSNSVVTLGEQDGALVELDRVDELGVNEQIQSVRWFDDLAIVVTFRQVDPLYAIDVSDPSKLELLGELKIPGFSAYLHPIGKDRLLGLGTDATKQGRSLGAQASTFDISDPTAPKQTDKVTYGRNSEVRAAWEPRQFTWLDDRSTALTLINRWGRGPANELSALAIGDDGTITNTVIPIAGGWRTSDSLRTLPLPDGRVVLTTHAEARFLSW